MLCPLLFLPSVMYYSKPSAAAYAEEDAFSFQVSPHDSPTLAEPADEILRVEILRENEDELVSPEKKILIYHTHTYEAYEQVENRYKEIEKWRTADSDYNVLAVGKALAASLRSMGFDVTHDETAFEPPTLEDAYSRSLSMLEARSAKGEVYDLYIDLHRDAISTSSTIKRTVNIGGERVARFMVLVGKGTTGGYTEKPDWEANLVIATAITDRLNAQCSGLARDVKIKTGRFNQHVSDSCVLIECGMNCNTLEEVLTGIPYLAQAISDTLTENSSR